jgi:hypothetical protein
VPCLAQPRHAKPYLTAPRPAKPRLVPPNHAGPHLTQPRRARPYHSSFRFRRCLRYPPLGVLAIRTLLWLLQNSLNPDVATAQTPAINRVDLSVAFLHTQILS